jgi:aromatic ring-opening dioxygenase catalytic subunit (LigB family)
MLARSCTHFAFVVFIILRTTMRYPAVFVNHGGGPMPLLGKQQNLVKHMKDLVKNYLPPEKPKAIVVFSAHWESDPVKITSSSNPKMLYDYYGFPPESYEYEYPAPGSTELAQRIHGLLTTQGIDSELDNERGFDHGVFVPLMIMYPDADIPVVCVSLHSSLAPEINIGIGQALKPLRDDGILDWDPATPFTISSHSSIHLLNLIRRRPSLTSGSNRQCRGMTCWTGWLNGRALLVLDWHTLEKNISFHSS